MMKIRPADLRTKVEPVEFIGGLFPKKHVTIIAAKAGAGKTFFCAWLMSQLSVGGWMFFDREIQRIPKRCVYFAGEAGSELMISRLQAIDDFNAVNIEVFSVIDILKAGGTVSLENEKTAKELMEIFYGFKPDCVIFDSLMSFRDKDESDQVTSSAMMTNVRRIAESTGAAVICTHHLRKKSTQATHQEGSQLDQDEIIGSSAIVRTASTAFILTGKNVKTLKCVKTWWIEPEQLQYKMVVQPDNKISFVPATDTDNETTKRLKMYNILQRLKGTEFSVQEIATRYGVSRNTVYNALKMCKYLQTENGHYIVTNEK